MSDYHDKRLARRLEDPEFRAEYEAARAGQVPSGGVTRFIEARFFELLLGLCCLVTVVVVGVLLPTEGS